VPVARLKWVPPERANNQIYVPTFRRKTLYRSTKERSLGAASLSLAWNSAKAGWKEAMGDGDALISTESDEILGFTAFGTEAGEVMAVV